MRECDYCGRSIVRKNAQARYCSDKCRTYDRRRKLRSPFPQELMQRDRWIRRSANKTPLQANGAAASSTDATTWASYDEASKSKVGVGLGFVLGDGIGGIDLDHCLTAGEPNEAARAFLEAYPRHYIEISPSGDGLHIFGTIEPGPGTRRNENGLAVERYSTGRYFTITGNVYQHGDILPL